MRPRPRGSFPLRLHAIVPAVGRAARALHGVAGPRLMIIDGTRLVVTDNSGAREVECIKVKGKYASIGDTITCSVKKAIPGKVSQVRARTPRLGPSPPRRPERGGRRGRVVERGRKRRGRATLWRARGRRAAARLAVVCAAPRRSAARRLVVRAAYLSESAGLLPVLPSSRRVTS